ncbi:MAG: hypothetical protein JNL62_00930 [Bryobacterales bacterium]|nr:hypothetical protein [Bryobacterales bacterium]
MTLRILLAALILAQLAGAQKLDVISVVLAQFEDGPSMPGKADYVGGETLFFSCQFSGYAKTEKETISLAYEMEAFDEKGVALVKKESKTIETELAPEDKDWKPKVRFQFVTPETALCENCVLRVKLTDKLAGTETMKEVPFRIRSRAIEPSATLTVRNFRYLRTEEDGRPLAVAAYRPGDELWARFEIVGFQHGDGNRIQVEYGLKVFRPSGKLLYEEPKAAVFDEASFYPKRYVNGILNLRLQGLSAGEYPVVLEVRDLVSGQKFEEKFPFKVE